MPPTLSSIRKKPLGTIVVVAVMVMGGVGAIWQLSSFAAAHAVSSEVEDGTLAGGAHVVADTAASAGQAVQFGAATPLPTQASDHGPIRFPDLAAARAQLKAPADANYVMWNPAWPVNRDIEDVFASLGPNDILVLPERAQPYVLDSSEGFRAAGVRSVTGRNGELPIVSRYKNIRPARTWFAMARAQRGIIGLGPNAVIEMSASNWTQEQQIPPTGQTVNGWASPGRFWTNTAGVRQSELVGAQEKMIESVNPSAYFGNFTMRGRDLGGVAYSALSASGGAATFEHLDLSGSWRGFKGIPNVETGGITVNRGTYLISKDVLGTRDSAGNRIGTSPIMINNSSGGLIEDTNVGETVAGMLTIWHSTGTHVLNNVNAGPNWHNAALNIEDAQAGFQLQMNGGSLWSDYNGRGGKPAPADQGTLGGMHISVNATGGSALITLRGVDLDNGPTPGALNIQSYHNSIERVSDIKAYTASGTPIPVKMY